MRREEKVLYLNKALSLQDIGANPEICDRIIETYELLLEMGGNFSVNDAVEIKYKMDKKYSKKELSEVN